MGIVRENSYRSMMCREVSEDDIGRPVVLSGWVASFRDHGGLVFVDLRDRSGVVQLVFDPERNPGAHKTAGEVRSEFVVRAAGRVAARPPGRENPSLQTGWVEVEVESLDILSTCPGLPFAIEDGIATGEEVRLRYRYLDLRRPEMSRILATRHSFIAGARDSLNRMEFLEIETPFLGKSTPEGARDYLVPSRTNPGMFYALPQSPQIYKQLLMVAGLDRYYQVARCLRDEDLRRERQPEFTQIDIEMSFVEQDDIFLMTETMLKDAFGAVGIEIDVPFPRTTYADVMERYGSDKPDLRYGLELVDIADVAAGTGSTIFQGALDKGGRVKALRAPGWSAKSRKDMDDYTERAKELGAKGLAWVKVGDDGGLSGPVAKFFAGELAGALIQKTASEPGDMILMVADSGHVVNQVLAAMRSTVAEEQGLASADSIVLTWITDFPLFHYDDEAKAWTSEHHPFTGPHPEDVDLIESDPGRVRSASYDLVINGFECASGSIRIHDSELQQRIFRRLQLSEEDIQKRFGFFTKALTYGAPPHGGIALGIDRIIAIVTRRPSIRDVIAFPKTQKAQDLMSGAPSRVSQAQLAELHIESTVDEE
ncbi:MAG: aspartate--tRNA ligase [Planctomycetes bacterium]|nr:aspartate--tRNA ligase [Planctomycetota bacterium]